MTQLPSPRSLALLLGALLLPACFKPYEELSVLDYTEIPFDNGLVASTDAVIRTYQTSLPCPDGKSARFYAVYRTELTEPAPVALLFHSGAFDYELDPTAEAGSTLDGVTWRGQSRLERDWSDGVVWETLGMLSDSTSDSELHLGALPAALVDAGVSMLIPGNCWGDLWHNESGFQDNDFVYETFSRDGRTFAWWMVRMLTEEGFAANISAELPFQSSGELYLVGLGDGGRAAVELLTHSDMPAVSGVLVDSTPDTLSAYFDPTLELDQEAEGLTRLWPSQLDRDEIDDWSLLGLVRARSSAPTPAPVPGDTGSTGGDTGAPDGSDTGTGPGSADDTGAPGGDGPGDTAAPPSVDTGAPETGGIDDLGSFALPARLAMVWSQADPQQPRAATEATADALETMDFAWVIDTQARGHVFTNSAPDAAAGLVDFLLTGSRPELDWTIPVDDAGDTGSTGDTTARLADCDP